MVHHHAKRLLKKGVLELIKRTTQLIVWKKSYADFDNTQVCMSFKLTLDIDVLLLVIKIMNQPLDRERKTFRFVAPLISRSNLRYPKL